MVVAWFYYPVWDPVNGSAKSYWQPKLRCLADALEDLSCLDLFA
jgi:hypothetical protein